MKIRTVALALLTVAFVAGTVMFGWWAIPVLGLLWGVWWESPIRSGLAAATSAMVSWGVLLGWSATQGPIGALSAKVAGVMGIPSLGLFAVAIALAGVLAGSGAVFSGSVRWLPSARRGARE